MIRLTSPRVSRVTSLLGRFRTVLASSAGIAIAMAVMNVGAYAFQMVAARLLGPVPYGAIAAVMNVLLIVGVVQLGFQATAARRIASDPQHAARVQHEILVVAVRVALGLGMVLALAAPLLDHFLKLGGVGSALMLAAASVPLTIMGAQAGILQGERRWLPLAWLYLSVGVTRIALGVVFLMVSPTAFGGMSAVALSLIVPVAIGWWALRGRPAPQEHTTRHSARALLREAVHSSQALLAFFVLANVDVLIARAILPEHEAGLYAAGVILSKAVLFLPQFVIVIAFPSMAGNNSDGRALWNGLGVVGLVGVVAVAGSVLLSGVAMVFVGGTAYFEVEDDLWVFAVLGTLMAMLQLLVYAVLARRGRLAVVVMWLAVAAAMAVSLTVVDTRQQLVSMFIVIDAVLLVALVGSAAYRFRQPRPTSRTATVLTP